MKRLPLLLFAAGAILAQNTAPDAALIAARNKTEKELESVAVIERKVMVPMRDGKRMAADIYRPKDASKKYPIIFVRTPYNFNYWDVRLGAPRDMANELKAVKKGYAFVEMNERGHFFSEGSYDILGPPLTDGTDAIYLDVRSSHGPAGRWAPSAARPQRSGSWAWRRWAIPAYHHHDPARIWGGRGTRGPLLRARQLVSRRRGADAVHRLDLRRAESGSSHVSARHARRKI
jgi:hypothetical protein